MSKGPLNIQDGFLNQVRRDRTPVDIHLVDGMDLHGLISAFDNFTVVLHNEERDKQYLVYKHSIGTISPKEAVRWSLAQRPGHRPGEEDSYNR